MRKNTMGKTVKVNEPYEIWLGIGLDWEWRVLKKYQRPGLEFKNPYARWFTAVKSENTFGSYDMGDTYVEEIKRNAHKLSDEEMKLHLADTKNKW
jgi:hypothetical protein